jgi:hypothetical protein
MANVHSGDLLHGLACSQLAGNGCSTTPAGCSGSRFYRPAEQPTWWFPSQQVSPSCGALQRCALRGQPKFFLYRTVVHATASLHRLMCMQVAAILVFSSVLTAKRPHEHGPLVLTVFNNRQLKHEQLVAHQTGAPYSVPGTLHTRLLYTSRMVTDQSPTRRLCGQLPADPLPQLASSTTHTAAAAPEGAPPTPPTTPLLPAIWHSATPLAALPHPSANCPLPPAAPLAMWCPSPCTCGCCCCWACK